MDQRFRAPSLEQTERALCYGHAGVVPAAVGLAPQDRLSSLPPFEGLYTRINLRPGLDVTLADMRTLGAFSNVATTQPCVAITVLIKGCGEGRLANASNSVGHSIPYTSDTTFIFFSEKPTAGAYRLPENAHFRAVELRVSHDFLERVGALPLFRNAGKTHPLHYLSSEHCWIGLFPTPPALRHAVESILPSEKMEHIQDLALEARSLDILNATIALMESGSAPETPGISTRDRRRLLEARKLMEEGIAHPWTIREISKRVGLNEKKLKTGFRMLFGTPVYTFLQQERLEQARLLLARSEGSVTEVALSVGYSNPSHFARLFKRQFGTVPSRFTMRGMTGTSSQAPST